MKLWANFSKLAKAVLSVGGKVAIEWPTGNSYWNEAAVKSFLRRYDVSYNRRVDGCAVGLRSVVTNKPLHKPWSIVTNCGAI